MSEPDLIGPDLVLLMLAGPQPTSGRIDGVTRLEKLMYLAERETDVGPLVDEAFSFRPYHYGPYSKQIAEDVEFLEQARLVREERVLEGNTLDEVEEAAAVGTDREGVERRFFLTDDGRDIAKVLCQRHPDVFNELSEIKAKYGNMPLRQLIRYVYTRYPDSAVFSKIKGDVL